MAWYKSGTCSVTSGSPTVTGTGTAWVDNVRIGSDGFVGPDGLLYEILKVVSSTEITLAAAYKGTTASSGGYAIAPIQGYTKELADKAAALIDQFSDAEATAASSASAAASSASAASNSAIAAASSASAASASETNAKNSETNAASSAAAAATSETKIAAAVTQAVTQAVAEAKLAAHPVGSYYWSSESTDPSTLFGGTWEQVKDRFVLAAGDSYAVGATGGEATHTLSISEMPTHSHSIRLNTEGADNGYGGFVPAMGTPCSIKTNTGGYPPVESSNGVFTDRVNPTDSIADSEFIQETGGSTPHNNMPPYIVAYCWKRTA